jgi:hypothetical protein
MKHVEYFDYLMKYWTHTLINRGGFEISYEVRSVASCTKQHVYRKILKYIVREEIINLYQVWQPFEQI